MKRTQRRVESEPVGKRPLRGLCSCWACGSTFYRPAELEAERPALTCGDEPCEVWRREREERWAKLANAEALDYDPKRRQLVAVEIVRSELLT